MTALPLPMPSMYASDKEWKEYMQRLTEDELWELLALLEWKCQEARKIVFEQLRHHTVVAAS